MNLVKVQKHRSPLLSAIRNISLADAGVSAVTLIRSLSVYITWLTENQKLVVSTFSGVVVYLTTLVMGVVMLLRHTDEKQNIPLMTDNGEDTSKIDMVREKLTENFVRISDNVVDKYDELSDKASEKNEMLKGHIDEHIRNIEEKRKNNDNRY